MVWTKSEWSEPNVKSKLHEEMVKIPMVLTLATPLLLCEARTKDFMASPLWILDWRRENVGLFSKWFFMISRQHMKVDSCITVAPLYCIHERVVKAIPICFHVSIHLFYKLLTVYWIKIRLLSKVQNNFSFTYSHNFRILRFPTDQLKYNCSLHKYLGTYSRELIF
jgi:hypothetical protein